MRDDDSAGRSDGRRGRLLVVSGLALAVLGVALFGSALVVLGPLPATLTEFALRWGVRGLAALLVAGGLWCAWTGWKRLHG
jgi:protein-S-isoprenylcysteine O-methyltransferase Ste14